MKKLVFLTFAIAIMQCAFASNFPFGKGRLVVKKVAWNAVRIQYFESDDTDMLPEWVYVGDEEVKTDDIDVKVDAQRMVVEVTGKDGKTVFTATDHRLNPMTVAGESAFEASLAFNSPKGEHLFGLGQFQDGYEDVSGLIRRLTQVNTQISIPMVVSNKGYGVLWNNYGLTDFNPANYEVVMQKSEDVGKSELVNVTSTEGGKQEMRQHNMFEATLQIEEAGEYALLLDVGQSMARRHNLVVDGKTVIEMQNTWLPPTASTKIYLTKGTHTLKAELTRNDKPKVLCKKVDNQTVFRSPAAKKVDYTVFVGNADEVIASYRQLTGQAKLLPKWAYGYIHCRERFHSQDELLATASRFRNEQLPADVMVQDWQYWGKYGWNAMKFDEAHYPNPKAMTDSLHAMNMRLMVSVWSKIDKNSEVGKMMLKDGNYIPNTDWVDFFSPKAASAYWQNFSQRLVPLGIDAWWQDATEPENDDLVGRRVNDGKWAGEWVGNIYPLLVNKTVYEGLRHDAPAKRPMILTRCGFSGIQRYGAAMWSGDVGNDWEAFRRQITAGLGMQAAGLPWWTYDAGGFFRPGNQYKDKEYIERMLRWVETSVYLPLMRVHGYMSNTEPWNYGAEAQGIFKRCLEERYRLLPYIYSNAADVAFKGYTLMRPLVFDFPNDEEAMKGGQQFMFGPSLLVCPVTAPNVKKWKAYLPEWKAGWYEFINGKHHDGGKHVDVDVDMASIPVFVKAGSILPYGINRQHTGENPGAPLDIRIYTGADATFSLYEDDGTSNAYEEGQYSRIEFTWDDAKKTLTIGKRNGSFEGMPRKRILNILVNGKSVKKVEYKGKKVVLKNM